MSSSNKPAMNWNAGDLAKEFKRFKQHCQFTFQGPLSEKSEKAKVNYFMTYIGDKGREVYETFTWTPAAAEGEADEQDTLQGVYTKYANYVAPKTNQIRATITFNGRKQIETETFDNFVTDLKILVKDCGYQDEERMIRDCIVLRSFHEKVKEKCVDEGDALTLDKAIEIGRNYETQLDSMKAIRGEEGNVNAVGGARPKRKFNKSDTKTTNYQNQSNRNQSNRNQTDRYQGNRKQSTCKKKCTKCGYSRHRRREKCPAQGMICDSVKEEITLPRYALRKIKIQLTKLRKNLAMNMKILKTLNMKMTCTFIQCTQLIRKTAHRKQMINGTKMLKCKGRKFACS
jgi:hypothetical protein